MMKALVAGWFSFEQMGASAGDLMARDLVCDWLRESQICYDIAVAIPFTDGVDWLHVEPSHYQAIVFVCGPFGNGPPLTEFLLKFRDIPMIGINLTMLDSLDKWNPFQLLLERDSDRGSRPDMVFLSKARRVAVAGKILVHKQSEYGDRGMHTQVGEAIDRLTESRELAVVSIDTRLDENNTGLRTPGEVESTIAKMDTVLTTRLHGMVLALKNGVPPLVIDPIAGGAKISRQAKTIGWPVVFKADELDHALLPRALDFCLSEEGKLKAAEICLKAKENLADLSARFVSHVQGIDSGEA